MYSYIILALIIVIGFFVCKRNYKNRATSINSNLLDYCSEIVINFQKLSFDCQINFRKSLSEKELELFNTILSKDVFLGNNLNILQSRMFTLEAIMKKLKAYNNEEL